jgi:hypothetical protein
VGSGETDCSARSFGLEATVTLGALRIVEASSMKRDREDVFTSKILRLDCGVVFFSRFIAMGYPICPSPTNPYLNGPFAEEYPLHPPATRPITVRPILNCNMSCAKLVDVEVFGEGGPCRAGDSGISVACALPVLYFAGFYRRAELACFHLFTCAK